MRANLLMENGDTGLYGADQEAVLLDRDYLSEYQRSYDSSGPSLDGGFSLFSLFGGGRQTVTTLENSYSLAAPVLSDDGGWLFYLDDGGDAGDATNVRVAVMARNGSNSYDEGAALDDGGYGDSGLTAAGTGETAVAVWSRVTECPAVTEPGQAVTPDVQAGMLNSSDIMVAVRSRDGWTVTNLTRGNGVADLSPVVAANGSRILVAWRQVASTNASDLTSFDAKDAICYVVSNDGGEGWSEVKPLYNGTSGAVKSLEAAMLPGGGAAVVFTLQTGEPENGAYHQEIAYAIVGKDDSRSGGEPDVARYVQLTDDTNLDENPQIAAVSLGKEDVFVPGWYSLNPASGASDIRLAAIEADGNRVTGFVDALSTLIQNAEVGISSNFQFSKNAKELDDLSILWSDTVSEVGTAAHDCLSAIRFRTETDGSGTPKVSVTSAQTLVEMEDYTTIDNFNAYAGGDGELYAALQGTYYDYDRPETYTVEYSDGSTRTVRVASDKTSIYTTVGAYTDTLRVDSVLPDYAAIRKGSQVPVQVSVTNLGTTPLKQVDVSIGSQSTTFVEGNGSAFVAIGPGETRNLTAFYMVQTEGAIPDPDYKVTGTFQNGNDTKEGTLILNIPDLGISNNDILVDSVNGDRILQFTFYNLSDAALADSGREVKFQIYSDADCTNAIDPKYLTRIQAGRTGEPLLTVSGADLAAIDNGAYTMQYQFDLQSYIKEEGFADDAGEVRDGGVTVYAKAWVELPGDNGGEMLEYNSRNNVAALTFESLLKQADGIPTTVTSALDNSGETSQVTVTLQNNSMVQKTTGNVIYTLLDEAGNALEQQQSYTGGTGDNGLITLDVEGRKTLDTVTFSQKAVNVQVVYTDAVLDDESNTAITSLNLDGVPLSYDERSGTWRNTGIYEVPSSARLSITTADPRASVTVNGQPYKVPVQQTLTEGDTTVTITVTAADGKTTETYYLRLSKPIPVTGVTLDETELSMTVGDRAALTAEVLPADAWNRGVRWSSDAPGVVAVENGTITAVSAGTAQIRITTLDGGYSAVCAVTVSEKPARPGGSGGGTASSTYAVKAEPSEHGKVTASPTSASSGSTITLTVTPDSGYVLDTLTVTDSRGNEIKLTAQSGGKYTFTMPSGAVTVKATFAPLLGDTEKPCDGGVDCPSRTFTDLGGVGTWYHESVDYALRNNLMGGYGNGLFGPNNNLTRAQLAQILYNREGRPAVTGSSPFTDVANGAWYSDAITWAAANGIVGGYGGGLFGPNDNITREQLAAILWRYSRSPAATNKELHFNDADEISGYALDSIRWAVEHGILNGFGDGRLGPKGLATREQVAQMLKNFIENQEANT